MIIREYSSQDTIVLEELYYFTQLETFITRADKSKFKIGDYQKSTADDDVWVADLNGILVGFVSVYTKDNFIHNLFVHPKYHNKGIGIALLKFAENFLKRPMTLKVALNNLKVCSFYEKYDWYQVLIDSEAREPYILYQKD